MNLYRHESTDATRNAQRNLDGRTHYVDASTLAYFNAKLIDSGDAYDGMAFYLIESYRVPGEKARRFRPVVFDITGRVIATREAADGFANARAARRNLEHVLASLGSRILEETRKGIDELETRYAYYVDRARAAADDYARKAQNHAVRTEILR